MPRIPRPPEVRGSIASSAPGNFVATGHLMTCLETIQCITTHTFKVVLGFLGAKIYLWARRVS